jgi:hypothetical protein
MPFRDSHSADVRLVGDETPLTEEEIRDLLPWVRVLSIGAKERLQTELSLMQLAALKRQETLANRQLESFRKFDASTATANRWMIGFTAAVTFMTLVMLIVAVYPLLREHYHSTALPSSETKQMAAPQVTSQDKAKQVKADAKTWGSAEIEVVCSKAQLLPWTALDGKSKQVTLDCTVTNHTDKTVPLAAPDKVDALFLLPDRGVVRGRAYLGSSHHEIPARGEVREAGLFPGNNDCPAKQSDSDCAQAELMKANELLLTDTVSGIRYHVRIE